MKSSFVFGISIWLTTSAASFAQEAPEIPVPVSSLDCLVENQEKYLTFPRDLLIFFVDLCPALSREEVAAIVQNSGGEQSGEPGQRLIMLKSDFRCLVEKITAHLDAPEATEIEAQDGDASEASTVSFPLDCG